MSFDRFLLAVESCDLSQADKILIMRYPLAKLSSLGNTFFSEKGLFTQTQTFCKMNPLNPLRFTSHQRNWDKCLLFQFYKTSIFEWYLKYVMKTQVHKTCSFKNYFNPLCSSSPGKRIFHAPENPFFFVMNFSSEQAYPINFGSHCTKYQVRSHHISILSRMRKTKKNYYTSQVDISFYFYEVE